VIGTPNSRRCPLRQIPRVWRRLPTVLAWPSQLSSVSGVIGSRSRSHCVRTGTAGFDLHSERERVEGMPPRDAGAQPRREKVSQGLTCQNPLCRNQQTGPSTALRARSVAGFATGSPGASPTLLFGERPTRPPVQSLHMDELLSCRWLKKTDHLSPRYRITRTVSLRAQAPPAVSHRVNHISTSRRLMSTCRAHAFYLAT
jgi:hypothetical protein